MARKFDLKSDADNLEELTRALERLHEDDGGDVGNTTMRPGKLLSPDEPLSAPDSSEEPPETPKPSTIKRERPTKYNLPLPVSAILFRVGMVLLSLLLVWLIYRGYLHVQGGGGKQVVPDIVGQQSPQALQHMPRGLRVKVEYDTTSTESAGTILKLTPPAGTRMTRSKAVTVTVAGRDNAAGAARPADTTAASEPEAQSSGTPVATPTTTAPVTTPPGTSTPTPKPGTSTTTPTQPEEAQPVTRVTIASDLLGKHERQARAALEALGLRVVTERGEDTAYASGVVLSTAPVPATEVNVGDTVTLTINDLSRFITVRGYVGRDGELVADDLRSLGLSVTLAREDGGQRGYVTRTDPPAGSFVRPGSAITVYVGQ